MSAALNGDVHTMTLSINKCSIRSLLHIQDKGSHYDYALQAIAGYRVGTRIIKFQWTEIVALQWCRPAVMAD